MCIQLTKFCNNNLATGLNFVCTRTPRHGGEDFWLKKSFHKMRSTPCYRLYPLVKWMPMNRKKKKRKRKFEYMTLNVPFAFPKIKSAALLGYMKITHDWLQRSFPPIYVHTWIFLLRRWIKYLMRNSSVP